jgi:hypothetical protein
MPDPNRPPIEMDDRARDVLRSHLEREGARHIRIRVGRG